MERIDEVLEAWETAWKVRALAVNNRSLVLRDLHELKKSNATEYRKLLTTIRLVAETERIQGSSRVERGRDHPEIFEMRAPKGLARLFYFYDHPRKVVVCTNFFKKARNKDRGQDEAFELADRLREAYRDSAQGVRDDQ